MGENASGCHKGKGNISLVSGEDRFKKKDKSTNGSLDKEKVSSCGSAGTKFSSPCSLGVSKEADSRDCVSLLDNNQLRPVGRCSTGVARASNGDNYCRQPVVRLYLLIYDPLM